MIAVPCVMHLQHLVAMHLTKIFTKVQTLSLAAVNKIKSNWLNNMIFTNLYDENDDDYNSLHREDLWLSKGSSLPKEILLTLWFGIEISGNKRSRVESKFDQLHNKHFLSDRFAKFNEMNLYFLLEALHKDYRSRNEDILIHQIPNWFWTFFLLEKKLKSTYKVILFNCTQ